MIDRGDILIQASTLYWDNPTCAACTDKGMGLWITDPAATVSFLSSAIGTQLILADTGPLLLGYNGTGGTSNRFASDALTWVQPTANQDAAALQAVLPSVHDQPTRTHLRRDGVPGPVHDGADPDAWHAPRLPGSCWTPCPTRNAVERTSC